MNARYVIIIPAKNEGKYISKTLQAIADQTIKPERVIVVNDNSTDDTRAVAEQFSFVDVIDSEIPDDIKRHGGILGKVIGKGIEYISSHNIDYDYLMPTLGGDDILDPKYLETVISGMTKDKVNLGGGWSTDRPMNKTVRHGAGMVMSKALVDSLRLDYLAKSGYEEYLNLKGVVMDQVRLPKVYDVTFSRQRVGFAHREADRLRQQGREYRQANPFVFGMLIMLYSIRGTSLADKLEHIRGFLAGDPDAYKLEPEIIGYRWQLFKKRLKSRITRIFSRS